MESGDSGLPAAGTLAIGELRLGVKAARLIQEAQRIAERTQDFFKTKGAGAGDLATNAFMNGLRQAARQAFDCNFSEAKICGKNNFTLDFYFPDEETAVEFAFSLSKPISEFERDIFKCLLAQHNGQIVRKLVLVGKPGALKRIASPGPRAIIEWVRSQHSLDVQVRELLPPDDSH